MPLEIERLIRNETLLTFFDDAGLRRVVFRAMRTGSAKWFALCSGLASGSDAVAQGHLPDLSRSWCWRSAAWNWRRQPARWCRARASATSCLFLLPLLASKAYDHLSGTGRPAEPEAGEMFYGRTAQWTYLDSGIVPEIKTRIRAQVDAYADRFRRTGKLDNNEIVKRTVVPSLKTILVDERHGQLVDVDHLCWRLGVEAVAHHPAAYLKQVIHDFYFLNFITAQRFIIFLPHQLRSAVHDAEGFLSSRPQGEQATGARYFDLPASRTAIDEASGKSSGLGHFSRFITATGHLRVVSPTFLTSLLLPLLVYATRGRRRIFWLGNTILWYYYLVLLSTVGRPLDRYLMPVIPIMFWTISAALSIGWRWMLNHRAARQAVAAR